MEAVLLGVDASVQRKTLDDPWARLMAWYTRARRADVAKERSEASARRAEAGDFQAFLDRHRGPLERLCFFRERDATRRQDLWQDVLLALWKSLPSFRGEGSERAWVLRIAHNVAASYAARALRARRFDDAQEPILVSGPDREAEAHELAERVRRMDLLSQQLVLLYLEGLTSKEIAEATGLSPTNVTTRLARVRQRLAAEEVSA